MNRRNMLKSFGSAVILGVATGCNPLKPSRNDFLTVMETHCSGCSMCATVCPADAVRINEEKAVIDLSKCTRCGRCVDVCPTHAIY